MRIIKKLAHRIEEELEDAKEYAEDYVEQKVKGNTMMANRFKEMSNDELKHAGYIHEMAVKEIEDISKVYTAPAEMMEKWEKEHKSFIEKTAWIRQMLSM